MYISCEVLYNKREKPSIYAETYTVYPARKGMKGRKEGKEDNSLLRRICTVHDSGTFLRPL